MCISNGNEKPGYASITSLAMIFFLDVISCSAGIPAAPTFSGIPAEDQEILKPPHKFPFSPRSAGTWPPQPKTGIPAEKKEILGDAEHPLEFPAEAPSRRGIPAEFPVNTCSLWSYKQCETLLRHPCSLEYWSVHA